jgi:F420-dependent oxidoreductase-like protein
MKLGLALGPWDGLSPLPIETIQRAEALGYDAVWTAETYGADAMTPLAFIAAHTRRIKLGTSIAVLDARTPANLAMCCQTIDALAGGGRMVLGLGASGPQIVEGWYGRPWGRPNLRIRDTVEILRKIFRREGHVSHEGREISLPYAGEESSGFGKPLKSILKATPDIPILLGAETPLNMRMTGEIADGWLGFHLTPSTAPAALKTLREGIDKRTDGKTLADFEIRAMVGVVVTDDVAAALQAPKPYIALYAGGMGAKSMNFHKNSLIKRGYGEAAERIQELFLAGRKAEAAAAVPDELVDEEWLIGPRERIKQRFQPWRDCGVTNLGVRMTDPETLEMMARIADS